MENCWLCDEEVLPDGRCSRCGVHQDYDPMDPDDDYDDPDLEPPPTDNWDGCLLCMAQFTSLEHALATAPPEVEVCPLCRATDENFDYVVSLYPQLTARNPDGTPR